MSATCSLLINRQGTRTTSILGIDKRVSVLIQILVFKSSPAYRRLAADNEIQAEYQLVLWMIGLSVIFISTGRPVSETLIGFLISSIRRVSFVKNASFEQASAVPLPIHNLNQYCELVVELFRDALLLQSPVYYEPKVYCGLHIGQARPNPASSMKRNHYKTKLQLPPELITW